MITNTKAVQNTSQGALRCFVFNYLWEFAKFLLRQNQSVSNAFSYVCTHPLTASPMKATRRGVSTCKVTHFFITTIKELHAYFHYFGLFVGRLKIICYLCNNKLTPLPKEQRAQGESFLFYGNSNPLQPTSDFGRRTNSDLKERRPCLYEWRQSQTLA